MTHSDDPNENLPPGGSEFSLGKPEDPEFQHMAEQPATASGSDVAGPENGKANKRSEDQEPKFKKMTWKGFEEEEEPEPQAPFGGRAEPDDDEMDLTPMVDVTFLLLIFFIVTASFQLQKAVQQPQHVSDSPANIVVDPKDEKDSIEIMIDENDNYVISSGDAEDEDAAGKVQMWQLVKKRKMNSPEITKVAIKLHEESSHAAKVYAWDASVDAGFTEITTQVVKQLD